jgi:hypothetical protein
MFRGEQNNMRVNQAQEKMMQLRHSVVMTGVRPLQGMLS